jgi:hypothetical protein
MAPQVYVFVDVDGYCVPGVDQRRLCAPGREGFRARELSWAIYHAAGGARGSVYFCDPPGIPPLNPRAPSIAIVRGMHGLPVNPAPADWGVGAAVMTADAVLPVFRALHTVACRFGETVVFVHKGGNEGVWAGLAIPGAVAVDLGRAGCPRVDKLAAGSDLRCCLHHDKKKAVHCPALEIELLARWAARGF